MVNANAQAHPVWYRSLYWRIALGFVALLAILLSAQGLVFLWVTGRVASEWLGRSALELAVSISGDLSRELAANSSLDVDGYVNTRYKGAFRSFVVLTTDGRIVYSRRVMPPPPAAGAARARLFEEGVTVAGRRPPDFDRGPGRGGGRRGFPRPDGPPGSEGFNRGDRERFRGPGGFGDRNPLAYEFGLITIAGNVTGVVAVPVAPPPLEVALTDLAPTLATVAFGLLVAGTALGALLVFRPTHRRLQALQAAARAVGAGQAAARAPESGGDEVSALAKAFNEMAGQLEQRTLALETADRTRRQLVADVSHELTTPLAAIRGYVETLSMPEIELDAASRARYLRIVSDETDRLEHIVGDLLDVARLEGGGGVFTIEEVPVTQLFERLRHRHAQGLAQKRITLDTSEDPEGLALRADAKRLEQALQNLVANAARHTPEDGRITVSAQRVDAGIRFVVEDTGPGIPPEHLDRVFDRFYKVDVSRTGTALPSGSGLGLSIVRAIVERHGGRIGVSNAPGSGARFEITLPDPPTGL
jgi:signal transduction histidine kinase